MSKSILYKSPEGKRMKYLQTSDYNTRVIHIEKCGHCNDCKLFKAKEEVDTVMLLKEESQLNSWDEMTFTHVSSLRTSVLLTSCVRQSDRGTQQEFHRLSLSSRTMARKPCRVNKTEQRIRCHHTSNLRCLQLRNIPLSGLHSSSADSELIVMTFPHV